MAKPAVVCDNDDEPQIEPQVLPTRKPEKNILDTSASEVTSDSDLSYNRYDVSNAEIHRQHHIPDDCEVEMFSCEDRAKDPDTSKPVVIYEDLKKPLTIPANPSPNKSGRRLENGFKKVESKQPNRPTSLHLGSKTDQETKSTPLATTRNSNGTTPSKKIFVYLQNHTSYAPLQKNYKFYCSFNNFKWQILCCYLISISIMLTNIFNTCFIL